MGTGSRWVIPQETIAAYAAGNAYAGAASPSPFSRYLHGHHHANQQEYPSHDDGSKKLMRRQRRPCRQAHGSTSFPFGESPFSFALFSSNPSGGSSNKPAASNTQESGAAANTRKGGAGSIVGTYASGKACEAASSCRAGSTSSGRFKGSGLRCLTWKCINSSLRQ